MCALRGEGGSELSSTSFPNPGEPFRTELEDTHETPSCFEVTWVWVEPVHAVVLNLEAPIVAIEVMTHRNRHALYQ